MDKPKMVVAYSGGLDTSVMVKWLHEKFNADVITATGDLGQAKELEGVKQKAFATGAVKAHIQDLKAEFLEDYVFPALRAGALYEGAYPMATSLGRPLLAKYMVEVARQEGASMVAHGCTGKGNDQVRFEVTINALAPDLQSDRAVARLGVQVARGRDRVRQGARYSGRGYGEEPVLHR